MLTSLHIQNVVLIDRLTLEWQRGLSALTGETGAGKSILLDALGLSIGARSDAGLLRIGADQASVTATFSLSKDHAVWAVLSEQELGAAADELTLRRVLSRDGRSKAFINDIPVQIATLRQIGDMLLEIHGQFATHALLNAATHRQTLDQFAGQGGQAKTVAAAWASWQRARQEHQALMQDAAHQAQEAAYLSASCDELTALDPQPGEEDSLHTRKTFLRNQATMIEAVDAALQSLQDDDRGARPALLQGWRTMSRQGDKGTEWDQAVAGFDTAISAVHELEAQLETLLRVISEGGMDLEAVEDRLYSLRAAARKYSCLADDLPQKLLEFQGKLHDATTLDTRIAALAAQVEDARKTYVQQAHILTAARQKAGQMLEKLVATELPPLKLEKARFIVAITPVPETQWGPQGCEDIAYLLSTHTDAAPAPLAKVASGGELSRLMLAIKLVLVDTSTATTLIFDEVDTGIGGATAAAVGERLARLGQGRQVLVVTHAPQVAARADYHLVVSKATQDGKMITSVTTLDSLPARREEIARMLAGSEITDAARAAAASLLQAVA
ncbi:MAG: DNA repair protein RecN [Pseudomonadota bacterium]